MIPPTVVHVNHEFDEYIGRRNPRRGLPESPWANRTPERTAASFDEWARSDDPAAVALRDRLGELAGKRLGCWCKKRGPDDPTPCHGDVLRALFIERFGPWGSTSS